VKSIGYTPAQKQRLRELGSHEAGLKKVFINVEERERIFNQLAKDLASGSREAIKALQHKPRKPILKVVEGMLSNSAICRGFMEVVTPSIIPRIFIERMGLKRTDKLWKQIIWLDERRCLRPMLAPNLYQLMGKLKRFFKPVRIFEVGSCFRKDTRGPLHIEEFTMFNLVEFVPPTDASERLSELLTSILKDVGVRKYEFKRETSEVYGSTVDIYVKGVEVASAVAGPHALDQNWNIVDPWVGAGFGVERLAMAIRRLNSVVRVGRSLAYLNGARLDIE